MSTTDTQPATTGTATAALYAALARAIGRAQAVEKESKNDYHRYKYASAEALIEEARGALAAEGLCVLPLTWFAVPRDLGEHSGPALGYFADLKVKYMVAHASGGTIEIETETPVISEKGRPEDKAVATALTYNLGYFLRGLLLLPRVEEGHDVDRRDDREYQPRNGQRQGQQERGPAPVNDGPKASGPSDNWPALLADLTPLATEAMIAHVGKPVAEWVEVDVEKVLAGLLAGGKTPKEVEDRIGAWAAAIGKHARARSRVEALQSGFRVAHKRRLEAIGKASKQTGAAA